MKLGIIADTHDNVPMIKRAVDVFNRENVDLVLHAGDYVSPFSLEPFFSLECDFMGVWGNNDGDKIALNRVGQGKIVDSPDLQTQGDKKILVGHHFETLQALILSQEFSLIVCGHTHRPEIRRHGGTLVVNPGECCGWLYGKSTVAVTDLKNLTAKMIEV